MPLRECADGPVVSLAVAMRCVFVHHTLSRSQDTRTCVDVCALELSWSGSPTRIFCGYKALFVHLTCV